MLSVLLSTDFSWFQMPELEVCYFCVQGNQKERQRAKRGETQCFNKWHNTFNNDVHQEKLRFTLKILSDYNNQDSNTTFYSNAGVQLSCESKRHKGGGSKRMHIGGRPWYPTKIEIIMQCLDVREGGNRRKKHGDSFKISIIYLNIIKYPARGI